MIAGGWGDKIDQFNIQKRSNGQLRKWTYRTLQEAQRKRDMVFG